MASDNRLSLRLSDGDWFTLQRIAHAKGVSANYPAAQVGLEAVQAFLRESIISGYVDDLETQAAQQDPSFVPWQKEALTDEGEG